MRKYTLMNDPDGLEYKFTGEVLGESTSHYDGALRWTEISIYKTDTGKYVVHNLGCSNVYHDKTSRCASGSMMTGNEIIAMVASDTQQWAPCPRCKPGEPIGRAEYMAEVDRSNVTVSTAPSGVVESLMAKDNDGVLYLTRTARRALENATKNDPALAQREVAV